MFLSGNSAGGIMMNHIIYDRKTPGVLGAWHSAYYKTQFADLSVDNLKVVGIPIAIKMGKLCIPKTLAIARLPPSSFWKKNVAAGNCRLWIGVPDGKV